MESLATIAGQLAERQYSYADKPEYLNRLSRAGLSQGKIAELVGKSDGAVSYYIRGEKRVPLCVELAARWVWENKYAPKQVSVEKTQVICIVRTDLEHVKTIKAVAEATGGQFSYVDMK